MKYSLISLIGVIERIHIKPSITPYIDGHRGEEGRGHIGYLIVGPKTIISEFVNIII